MAAVWSAAVAAVEFAAVAAVESAAAPEVAAVDVLEAAGWVETGCSLVLAVMAAVA